MSLPKMVLIAIAEAVAAQGGDMDDVDDLVACWERVYGDRAGRVDRLRYDAENAPCRCADGGVADDGGGRCGRCCGLIVREQLR
ncbi:MAG: hypothetical protein JWN32_1951 [Solirubrobacterales bacterium]|jgi:hypothetical protein|nr:hypothetical protein [Solirubrobacterales bacterium]